MRWSAIADPTGNINPCNNQTLLNRYNNSSNEKYVMKKWIRSVLFLFLICGISPTCGAAEAEVKPLRAGIIGLDTSHVIAFTKILNATDVKPELAGCRVVAAYPQGSPDIESSTSRIPKYTEQIQELGVEIVDSIETLLTKVGVVFLETNDGRPHWKQARKVLRAGKPVFIDKPVAGSLRDAIAIYEEARRLKVPMFSCSSLRFSREVVKMREGAVGKIIGCDAFSPCPLEPTHPDLFWYGIHGVETLFTVMGPGCKSVVRVKTDGSDVVVGKWEDGRIGTFRGIRASRRGNGGTAFGTKGIQTFGRPDRFEPMLIEIIKFFRSGKPPVTAEETLEIYAFMEAADESWEKGGIPVSLDQIMKRSQKEARQLLK